MTLSPLAHPLTIGPLTARNRVWVPPHGGFVGMPFSNSDAHVAKNVAYWASRAADGAGVVCGLQGFLDNSILIPGFEPTGMGARTVGTFRLPNFLDCARRHVDAIRATGALVGIQFIQQGATPHSPSGVLANYANNLTPHALTRREIEWFVQEYGYSAARSAEAGFDIIEIHANHEDLMHLFLSPATNLRTDRYGGDLEGRTLLLREVLRSVRSNMSDSMALGVRFNMDELFEGGYDRTGGLAIAQRLVATGDIDYLHCVMGNNWGAPSYVQPHHYGPAAWADLAGEFRAALTVPIVYTGRVSSADVATDVVARGNADAVGVARALFADHQFISKTLVGRGAEIRPCIGTNDCLHRGVVDGVGFGCSVNPAAGRESEPSPARTDTARRVLVVGTGPAGLEVAALLAERGHHVEAWEREDAVGGQMRVAAHAVENAAYWAFLDHQERRLHDLGVRLRLGHTATAGSVLAGRYDVVVLATGSRPRRPALPGFDAQRVVEGRDVLTGRAGVGNRVAVVATEDHMQPLTIAGHVARLASSTTVFYPTPAVAPLVGKYSIGAPFAALTANGGNVLVAERVVGIEEDVVVSRNVYSGTETRHPGFDTVVLACGGEAESALFHELEGQGPEVHVLGDAYAPRRISFATRQAYELAMTI